MMGMPLESGLRLAVKGTIIILMLAKAFYIVAYFMHLGHELKNLIMTIVVPLALFVWFIIAFLYDGNSFRHLRNTYDPHYKEQSTIKVEKKEHGEGHGAAANMKVPLQKKNTRTPRMPRRNRWNKIVVNILSNIIKPSFPCDGFFIDIPVMNKKALSPDFP
jgi:cytochrome c oxidase subunit 4